MTFLSRTYQQEVELIIKKIYKETADEQVAKVIGQPRIPLLSLALHFLFLKEKRYSSVQISNYCTSTTLVQMGLNIHSEVSVDDLTARPEETRLRQMQVLAGDLYSGKFYQLLALGGDVRVIRFLSEAICRINEAKTNLYMLLDKNQLPFKQYVREVEKICSALLTAWVTHEEAHPSEGGEWRRLIANLLTAERLVDDLDYAEGLTRERGLIGQSKKKIQQLLAQSRQLLQNWRCHDTKRELEHVMDVHFSGVSGLGKTAEEC